MKRIARILAAAITALMVACSFGNSSKQSITIRKTETTYQLKASFPKAKRQRVFNYIKTALNEDRLFSDPSGANESDVNLGDTLKFNLNYAADEVALTFRKTDHTLANYQKMEKICNGLKEVLR